MRDRHPIWFITVRPYTTTLIITCNNDLDLTAALKKKSIALFGEDLLSS